MEISSVDKKEKFLFRETLSSVLLGMVDKETVIDLRNEASIHGKIVAVSGYMDVELEKCVFRNPRGEFFPFDTFFIKSRNIRYVHLPKDLNAASALHLALEKLNQHKVHKSVKRTFKTKRAQVYQNELLKELHEQQNQASTSSN